jgi:hypothetical protein
MTAITAPPPARDDRKPDDAPAERPGVCTAHGRCPGLWCRIMRRCFQGEAA